MPTTEDTVQSTETPQDDNGSQQDPQVSTPASDAQPVEEPQNQVDPEKERLQTELNKARQRANQLENQQKKEREAALVEQNRYKELYEQKQAEEAQREEQQNLKRIRDAAIDEYSNPTVKEMAKKLISKNESALFWQSATDEVDAKQQVKAQLDALAEVAGTPPQNSNENAPSVDGNNPLPPAGNSPQNETRQERIKRLEKELDGYKF